MRILPSVLKELLKHVPTVLFEAVEWKTLAQELPKLSRRIIQKEGYEDLFNLQKKYLASFAINLVDKVDKNFHQEDPKLAAQKVLTLYFAQLYSPHGIFLDHSPSHFELKQEALEFHPSGLWVQFHPEFKAGIEELYDGFYQGDDKLFHQGLIKSGLTSANWPQADQENLAQLFKSHFGASLTEEMSFDLDTFKQSFLKVAHFLLEKKVNISTDFLYLGIALVTMYSSLEKTQARVNVKDIYFNVRSKTKQ